MILMVRSLDRGGAERQVIVLARALRAMGATVKVITFYDGGALRAELRESEVPLFSLAKSTRWDVIRFIFRLVQMLRREEPSVLYTFLTVPNVIAAAIKPWLRRTRIVWGVRASDMDLTRYDWLARATARLERFLARCADLIIFNSHAGLEHALTRGFPQEKSVVIPNGIDTQLFFPDPSGRTIVRSQWGLSGDNIAVGLVARLDPMKDHENFLRAAKIVVERCPTARFVCIGDGPAERASSMHLLASELGIADHMIWAGPLDNMRAVNSALDIACSASRYGEGFSNSIAEAMACGTTCVVTDTGDSSRVVGDTGVVVPAADPDKLACGILEVVALGPDGRVAQGRRARSRIEGEFGVEKLVRRTLEALRVSGGQRA
jgi:glycosyltransferase involved in cell wall biosynthesis